VLRMRLDEPDLAAGGDGEAFAHVLSIRELGGARGGARRRLQGELLTSGPAGFASMPAPGLSSDPEVSRFQQYIATLAPAVLATYVFLGAILFITVCCCVGACTWCCCLALLPTEVCLACKPTCCL